MKRKYEIAVLSKGGFARTVRIFAPKKADRAIIMHDGQNVFYDRDATFKKSWRALDVLKELGIKNTAIIGIDSTPTREYDYLPFPSELERYDIPQMGGGADAYMEYLETIILPYLDKRFGFKKYAMLGSSAGALATLYFAARRNHKVTAYGLFSTPLFVSAAAFKQFFDSASFDSNALYHVYCGGNEGTLKGEELKALESDLYVQDAFTLTQALRKSKAQAIHVDIINTATHDEINWRTPERKFFKLFAEL